jgi:coenzyme Q-binding protein COQ10
MLSTQAERRLPYDEIALFDLAADVEGYPFFLPGWIEARIERRDGERCEATQTVGFGPMRLCFRTQVLLQRPERIEITSDDPRIRRLSLSWRFAASPAGGSRVALLLEIELRSRLLQHSLELMAPAAAGDILRAFEEQARQRLQPSGGP